MEEDGGGSDGDRGRTAEEDGGAPALRARWGLKFGTTDRGDGGVRWRRAGEGGSFISLPHGIIYREDFRESTQRAPR